MSHLEAQLVYKLILFRSISTDTTKMSIFKMEALRIVSLDNSNMSHLGTICNDLFMLATLHSVVN